MLFVKNMAKNRIGWLVASLLAMSVTSFGGMSPQSLGGISLTDVRPRVITPNGDQLNDVAYFLFGDNTISGLPIEGTVFDINGAEVATLALSTNEDALIWDGKDKGGRILPSGLYIYSIKLGNHQATGTIVVAR